MEPRPTSSFLVWLLEKRFLVETPYPKVGDIVLAKQGGEVTFVGVLPREGVLQEQFPGSELHFYLAIHHEEWVRLYAQFQEG